MASALVTSPGASRPTLPAGGPLRYANAEDLPSYPSPGLGAGGAAAGAAVTLGRSNTIAFPVSKLRGPPRVPPASRNSLLAAGWAQRHQNQHPSPPSAWVSTAANLAFTASKTQPPSTEQPSYDRQNSMRAAKGAMTGPRPRASSSPQARETKDRDRDQTAADALRAATVAHRPRMHATTVSAGEAGAVPYTTMDRQMFTSNPPVKPETDEQQRAQVLHASALAMARMMYDQQQRVVENSFRAHTRSLSYPGHDADLQTGAGTGGQRPVVFNSLQEAAYRQAQARLAKLQEEHQMQRDLQEYYGTPRAPHHNMIGSIKGKLTRRRSSSDGDLVEDRRRSQQIRNQMSLLNNKLTELDEEKRAQDREALLAAAQRNVKTQLQEMDKKLQSESGRVPQTNMDDWGRKARVAAQARFDAANNDHVGKVDIGGGKFMDRSEVEKIAAKKVKPLLDEINDRAEKEKERQEREREEEEMRREEAETERLKEKEIEEIHRKLKHQQKDVERARQAEIKHEEKMRKEEARAIKAEQKQAIKSEKQKEKEALPAPETAKPEAGQAGQIPRLAQNKRSSGLGHVRALSVNFPKRQPRPRKGKAGLTVIPPSPPTEKPPPPAEDSARSPTQKVRAWLLSRFHRPGAKSSSSSFAAATAPAAAARDANDDGSADNPKRGFIGGVALARLQGRNVSSSRSSSSSSTRPSVDGLGHGGGDGDGTDGAGREGVGRKKRKGPMTISSSSGGAGVRPASSSMREVAMAGRRQGETETFQQQQQQQQQPPVRRRAAAEEDERGESSAAAAAAGPRPVSQASSTIPASVSEQSVGSLGSSSGGGRSSSSSNGGSSGEEKFVEARSEPEGSPLPWTPPRTRVGAGVTGRASPFRESRFSEILE